MYGGMKNKMARRFVVRLSVVLFLCVGIFAFSVFLMSGKSARTIGAVGDVYMHSMSDEISLHFETAVKMRYEQLQTLVRETDVQKLGNELFLETLVQGIKLRDFSYLALYTKGSGYEILLGEPLTLDDPERFADALENGEQKIALGVDSAGNKWIVLGLPETGLYDAKEGAVSMVAGFSADYIKETLSLDVSGSLVYSHIISRDGNYVIRSGEAYRDNYFERLEAEATNNGGMYVEELRKAIEANGHYSAVVTAQGERRHMHSTKLAFSEWYLIVVMPYNSLDAEISALSRQWLYMAFGGCAVVSLALLWVFGTYLRDMRKQMEELDRVRQEAVDANKAKSEFLSNMSHDIRTPMNAIVGMTAIATSNLEDRKQVQNCLKKITMSSKHLLGLINDVLDMSKIESGKMTLTMDQISLRETMESVVGIIQSQVSAKNQRFDVLIHDISTEQVCCDSVRLNQVLLNLLGNSVKFTPDGGSITLSLFEEASPKGENFVRVHLIVEDTGIGMTPEFQEKIFEAFSRADSKRVQKIEGSGLGMAITRYIVDAMGGSIDIHSEPGKGSSFRITLDLAKAQVAESDMVLPKCRMLVIDDDDRSCDGIRLSLGNLGVCADTAVDTDKAMALLAEEQGKEEGYRLLLLDWKMPDKDGITLTREIRSLYGPDIPIVLISAYDNSEMEAEAKAAGVNGFLSKPLFKSTLYYGLKPFLTDELQQEEQKQETQDGFEGRRVLLAEDNDLNWEIANELLSELGLELDWAENGQICLDKFIQSQEGYYDAVLMDLRMPVMNGYEAAAAIRGLDREDAGQIPIIAMTADAFAEDVKHCLDCGMNAHISKPIDIKEVARLLKKYM